MMAVLGGNEREIAWMASTQLQAYCGIFGAGSIEHLERRVDWLKKQLLCCQPLARSACGGLGSA